MVGLEVSPKLQWVADGKLYGVQEATLWFEKLCATESSGSSSMIQNIPTAPYPQLNVEPLSTVVLLVFGDTLW